MSKVFNPHKRIKPADKVATKPAEDRPKDPLAQFVGQLINVQTKSPSSFTGYVKSMGRSHVVLRDAVENRWEGNTTTEVQRYSTVFIERSAINYFGVVGEVER